MSRPRKVDRHLPPCVYLKHGAYWYVRSGKWQRLGAGLAEALAEYATLHPGAGSGGMPQLIDKVLAHIKPKLARSTVAQYATAGRALKKALVEFSPTQVRPKHVAAIKAAMSAKPNMGNRMLAVLRIVFAYAVEWQLVDSNPCVGILRHVEAKRTRYLTDTELEAIHAKAGPRTQAIIDLCYLTGQRISDVLAIRRAAITDAGIEFAQAKTGTKLTVAWSLGLRAVVERAKTLYGNITALTLLHNRRGKRPDYRTVRDQWARACKAAGVTDAHLHDLRAKALTDARRQGLNATALAGHTSAQMTERYIRLRESPVVHGPDGRKASNG